MVDQGSGFVIPPEWDRWSREPHGTQGQSGSSSFFRGGSLRVQDIMDTHFLKVEFGDLLESFRGRIWPGQLVVVVDNERIIHSKVITEEQVLSLDKKTDKLWDVQDQLIQPAFVRPSDSIDRLVRGMLLDVRVRWFLALEEQEVVGLVSPFAVFSGVHTANIRLNFAPEMSKGGAPPNNLFGNPGTGCPDDICYWCRNENKEFSCIELDFDNATAQPRCPNNRNHKIIQQTCQTT
jgi:hypothetical protein